MKAGERFLLQTAGGGGFGSARERDPALVKKDVAEGYVSRAAAADYGWTDETK
jgi:N-methylhydantoinase B